MLVAMVVVVPTGATSGCAPGEKRVTLMRPWSPRTDPSGSFSPISRWFPLLAFRFCDSTTTFRKHELGAHGTCPAMSRLEPGKTIVQGCPRARWVDFLRGGGNVPV